MFIALHFVWLRTPLPGNCQLMLICRRCWKELTYFMKQRKTFQEFDFKSMEKKTGYQTWVRAALDSIHKDMVTMQHEKSTSGFRTTYTMRMKSSLMLKQSHTKTPPPSIYCVWTALKLLYVAKGLKYRWYHRYDVMQFSTLVLPKPCWSVGVSNLQTWVAEVTVQRQWSFFFVVGE